MCPVTVVVSLLTNARFHAGLTRIAIGVFHALDGKAADAVNADLAREWAVGRDLAHGAVFTAPEFADLALVAFPVHIAFARR